MRLDKFLTKCGLGTRSEVKVLLKQRRIKVNNIITSIGKTEIIDQVVYFDDLLLEYKEFVYIMLNKPQDVVSATKDNLHKTVVDLIEGYSHYDLHPVGRLDIDTEGLVILTNDGKLTHNIISPKKHVPKKYYVKLRDEIHENSVIQFKEGITIDDYKCMSSELEIINEREVELTIFEGKFHQVKRMFLTLGNKVVYLKRLSINNVVLDDDLNIGEYRELTNEELKTLSK
ncbi:16S rRNA pseudouridine(516) synthase [Mycoplasmatota bacterium WC44]